MNRSHAEPFNNENLEKKNNNNKQQQKETGNVKNEKQRKRKPNCFAIFEIQRKKKQKKTKDDINQSKRFDQLTQPHNNHIEFNKTQ